MFTDSLAIFIPEDANGVQRRHVRTPHRLSNALFTNTVAPYGELTGLLYAEIPRDDTVAKVVYQPAKNRLHRPLHDLRYTCATIFLMAGKHPKFVQEVFGHANICITLDSYSHVIESMEGGIADAIDEAL